jgi:hypothetical protein
VPQAPQFVTSFVRFAHRPPHSPLPLGQSQVPPAQTLPTGQALPQPPQFAGSFRGSMHRPLQVRQFGLHVQAPAMHHSPTPHACPQVPQLVPSLRSCTHCVPHTVRPSPQVVVQSRRLQTWSAAQARPHAPQFS